MSLQDPKLTRNIRSGSADVQESPTQPPTAAPAEQTLPRLGAAGPLLKG